MPIFHRRIFRSTSQWPQDHPRQRERALIIVKIKVKMGTSSWLFPWEEKVGYNQEWGLYRESVGYGRSAKQPNIVTSILLGVGWDAEFMTTQQCSNPFSCCSCHLGKCKLKLIASAVQLIKGQSGLMGARSEIKSFIGKIQSHTSGLLIMKQQRSRDGIEVSQRPGLPSLEFTRNGSLFSNTSFVCTSTWKKSCRRPGDYWLHVGGLKGLL